jgi:hypothetical protein
MDRAQAVRLVAKLRALGADRAATEAEKVLARAKADELSTRFRLGVVEPGSRHPHARRRHRARRARVTSLDPNWPLAGPRGRTSSNVKVEHHWGDWKLTVEIGWSTRSAFVGTGRPVAPAASVSSPPASAKRPLD